MLRTDSRRSRNASDADSRVTGMNFHPGTRTDLSAIPGFDRAVLVRSWGGQCAYYGDPLVAGQTHFDHVIPLSRGGASDVTNLVPACAECNLSKGSMTAQKYIEQRRSTGVRCATLSSQSRGRSRRRKDSARGASMTFATFEKVWRLR